MNVAMVFQLAVLRVVPNCCREKERERERERVKCSKGGRVKCGEWENDDLIGDETSRKIKLKTMMTLTKFWCVGVLQNFWLKLNDGSLS